MDGDWVLHSMHQHNTNNSVFEERSGVRDSVIYGPQLVVQEYYLRGQFCRPVVLQPGTNSSRGCDNG